MDPKAFFGSLEGKGGFWEKRKEQVDEIKDFERGGFWGVHFSSYYRILLIWENSKIVLEEGLEGFI